MIRIAKYMNWIPSKCYEGMYVKQNGTKIYFDMNDASECFNKMVKLNDVNKFLKYSQEFISCKGMNKTYDLTMFLFQNPHSFFIVMDDWLKNKKIFL